MVEEVLSPGVRTGKSAVRVASDVPSAATVPAILGGDRPAVHLGDSAARGGRVIEDTGHLQDLTNRKHIGLLTGRVKIELEPLAGVMRRRVTPGSRRSVGPPLPRKNQPGVYQGPSMSQVQFASGRQCRARPRADLTEGEREAPNRARLRRDAVADAQAGGPSRLARV